MYYITDRYGFVSGFIVAEDREGEQVLKAQHCLDLREAKPYPTRNKAEQAYKRSHSAGWWHCVVNSDIEAVSKAECAEPYKDLLIRAAEKLDGVAGDDPLATEIYDLLEP